MGIGNELNGDDAVGVMVSRRLKALLADRPQLSGKVLILEAATAPESFTGPLRRFEPDLVIMVDAAYLENEPGAVEWIDWQNADGVSASTHGLPPTLLAKFLMVELGCRVRLIGIQPVHLDFDRPMSEAVVRAVERVSLDLALINFGLNFRF
jgi:hydrogenase 3 maturation protease